MKYFIAKFTIRQGDGAAAAVDEETMDTARVLTAALAGEAGFESFEDTDEGINGYVQQSHFSEAVLRESLGAFPMPGITVDYAMAVAEDRNWNEEWENAGFEPIRIGERCIIHDAGHREEAAPYPIDIEINARQAFGTGTHNTTRMIVGQLLGTDLRGKQVLDCGCGTGILSIVASKCGAAGITAYDIDEWSVENTRQNAATNAVGNIRALLGDAGILEGMEEKFDVVLANINRNILLGDMEAMTRRLKADGVLIISGFYTEDKPLLQEKAGALELSLATEREDENWCMLVFGRE